MRQAICFLTQFADDRHIKNQSARVSLIFCPICRDCHVKNQSARAFLGFGASFYRHTPRLFAIYTGIAVPSRNFIRLLGHLLTSNRKISLFFSSVSSFFPFRALGSVLLNLNMKKKREDAVLCASIHTRTICTCIRLSLATWTACKERPSILLHSTLLLVLLFLT